MDNHQKYDQVFIETFSLEASALQNNPVYNTIPEWDSIGHMGMVAALEEAFDIMMETDDIVDFSSYKKGMELLTKYGIEFQ
ncbi:MAG: acyl carrier protein [Thermodesulfobacteriota bacterium]|nr:acyl carrier protein [Thermodesulfobacteriota bacterium]